MDHRPLLITLVGVFGLGPARYQVLAAPPDAQPSAGYGSEIATLALNRSITFPDGHVYSIRRRGNLFSSERELVAGDSASQPPLARYVHERLGLLRRRDVVIADAAAGPERRYLLRRRKWYGSPAYCDLLPLAPSGTHAQETVLLRAQMTGGWRRRLQALLSSPTEPSLPVVIFVLNVLADLDRRAAAAASAGASGA